MPSKEVVNWLRTQFFPHMWCPGCGHGIILHALLRSLVDLGKQPDQTVIASGIGCSSRMPGYINACTVHSTHGRSLAFATGIKLAQPEMTVIDVMGDGDCSAIGGNHFIHACRRNINITAIVMNNNIYGMTGGQASPTTPMTARATTAPYGVFDSSFDICKLAEGAGATFVARSTVANPVQCEKFIKDGIEHNGFSVVEILSYCHTQYGRRNACRTPIENINRLKESSISVQKTKDMSPEELQGKFVTGEFVNIKAPEFTEQYSELVERVKGAE
jgi:2-oxoglutarate ferredoxin oxidoreductase subunit beta